MTYDQGTVFKNLYQDPSRNGLTKPKKIRGEGIKFVNMGELFQHDRIFNPECDRVPVTDKERETSLLAINDLLFARQSLVVEGAGKCSIILGCNEETTFDSHIIRVRLDQKKCSPLFYHYFFKSPQGKNLIQPIVEQGGGAAGIRGGDLKKLIVPCPPLQVQQAIAHILGTLDDKIELNRAMNETLEAIARAIFNSWFVDFDPVKAKIEGQQPDGVDKESRVLFPDSLLESDMGMIPEGWSVGVLGKVALNHRKSVKPQDIHSTIPYIGLEHMPRKSIALSSWGYSEKVASNKSEFVSGDFLFGKLRPYFHKVGIAVTDGVCSTDILVVRPIDEAFYGFVIMLISSDEFIEYAKRLSTGSKMPRTNWKDMGKYNIVIPPKELAQRFSDMVAPMFRKIKNNIAENKSLEDIRDTLLPKLISGELSVSEVEKKLAKAL